MPEDFESSSITEVVEDAIRYRKVRQMNPMEFALLYQKNLSTNVPFDELVDQWEPIR